MDPISPITEKDLINLAENFYNSKDQESKIKYEKTLLFLQSHPSFFDIIFNIISIPDSNESFNLFFIGLLKEEFNRLFLTNSPRLSNFYF